MEETTLEDWRKITRVNVEGVFLDCKLAFPLLRKAGARTPFGAATVNLSSVAGLGGDELYTAYCASKCAVRLFTKTCAMEFAALKASFRLGDHADGEGPAYPEMKRPPLNLDAAHADALRIDQANAEFRRIAPGEGSYVSEGNYFNPRWREASWGDTPNTSPR